MTRRTPFVPFTSRYVVMHRENIDTDQIIPARFLTTIERSGLGPLAFHDWRYDASGSPVPGFPLNDPAAADAHVLVAGRNFGCGSSREHAVWALQGAGFRAVISSGFADIFRANALGNGLLPIQLEAEVLRALMEHRAGPEARIGVDLASRRVTLPAGGVIEFPIAPFVRHCLLRGIDELDYLLGASNGIARYEAAHPARVRTTAKPAPPTPAPERRA